MGYYHTCGVQKCGSVQKPPRKAHSFPVFRGKPNGINENYPYRKACARITKEFEDVSVQEDKWSEFKNDGKWR